MSTDADDDDEADDLFAPPAVRFDLSPARVDQMARSLGALLDTQEIELLKPRLRSEHQAVVEQIGAMNWADLAHAADDAIEILKIATHPGRTIDPADEQGDVPWCMMLTRLAEVPVLGSRAARKWFVHLHHLRGEDVAVSTLVEAVAAYAVAAFENLRGRAHEVERWSLTASLQTDFDVPGTRGAVAYVRAARLLQGLLPQQPPSRP